MNQVDKISKEALDLLQYAKDTAIANLTIANSAGKLNQQLEPAQLLAESNLRNKNRPKLKYQIKRSKS